MKFFLIKKLRAKLQIGSTNKACRNFLGRKTVLTQSGGAKKYLRLLDYGRRIGNAILLRLEKDINRTGLVGLMCAENGFFS
jgi:ribosomal protein L2